MHQHLFHVRRHGIGLVVATFAVACILSGCAESPEEKAARQDALCQSYGAKPGTDQYIQCRATIHMGEVIDRRARDAGQTAQVAYSTAIMGASAASTSRR